MRITFDSVILHFSEGVAVTILIYALSKFHGKTPLDLKSALFCLITITGSFFLLDLFAPDIAGGARQGTGFGIGFNKLVQPPQIAGDGNIMPQRYYQPIVEGMDDKQAVKYYSKVNPDQLQAGTPSTILNAYRGAPFDTQNKA